MINVSSEIMAEILGADELIACGKFWSHVQTKKLNNLSFDKLLCLYWRNNLILTWSSEALKSTLNFILFSMHYFTHQDLLTTMGEETNLDRFVSRTTSKSHELSINFQAYFCQFSCWTHSPLCAYIYSIHYLL